MGRCGTVGAAAVHPVQRPAAGSNGWLVTVPWDRFAAVPEHPARVPLDTLPQPEAAARTPSGRRGWSGRTRSRWSVGLATSGLFEDRRARYLV